MEKRKRLALVLVALFMTVLTVFPSIHVVDAQTLTRVGALTLNPGENPLYVSVIDSAAGLAYFGTGRSPGVVVKVRLSDFTRVGALTLNAGEGPLTSAAIDPATGFAYFGTTSSPSFVVKVRLSNFTRVAALTLSPGEYDVRSAVIDPVAGFAYFGTVIFVQSSGSFTGVVVKVRLSDFTRVATLTLNPGETIAYRASVIDSAAGFAYFGTDTSPSSVVKVRLSDFTRVGALTFNFFEGLVSSAVIDPAAGFAYFGTGPSPGIVVKVRLSDLTRVDGLTLSAGEDDLNAAVIDSTVGFAYFGTQEGAVAEVRLSDFTQGVLTLNPGENNLSTAVIDPAAGFAYFATAATIVKIMITPLHTTTTTTSCVPGSLVVNSSSTCTGTITDTSASPTTPRGIVGFTTSGAGVFSDSLCFLSGSGATAYCRVTYTPIGVGTGSHTITATFDVGFGQSGGSNTTTVTVTKTTPTLTTTLSSTKIIQGGSVTDFATLTNSFRAGGTVAYHFFAGSTCAGTDTVVGGPVTVTNGLVPSSASQTFNTSGSFSWNAVYSGDSNNDRATSGCEPLTVTSPVLLSFQGFNLDDFDNGVGQLQVLVNEQLVVDIPAGLNHLSGSGDYTPYTNTWINFGPFDITNIIVQGQNTIVFTSPPPGHFGLVKNILITQGNTILVRVNGARQVSASRSVTFTFSNPPLTIPSFTVPNPPPSEGQAVGFAATYTGGTGPYRCVFRFGDGEFSVAGGASGTCSVTHGYDDSGTFRATVQIMGSNVSDNVLASVSIAIFAYR